MRLRAHQRAFRSPFGNLRSPLEAIERPVGLQALPSRRSRRVKPRQGQRYAPAGAPKGFPLAIWKPSVATRSNRAPNRAASPALAPESARQALPGEFLAAKLLLIDASRGLFSGQTICAPRITVRSACCLPELLQTQFIHSPVKSPFAFSQNPC